MALAYPGDTSESDCTLLFIPSYLVPIIGGLLSSLQYRARWVSDEDYQLGYRAIAQLETQLINNCFSQLVQEIRNLRGVKEEYESIPLDERTDDMYRNINELTVYLNNIHFALNGFSADEDSILTAIRGIVPADEDRNILEALS